MIILMLVLCVKSALRAEYLVSTRDTRFLQNQFEVLFLQETGLYSTMEEDNVNGEHTLDRIIVERCFGGCVVYGMYSVRGC